MLEMLMQWYRRRFSDPEAIALLVILLAGFGIMFFSAACWPRCWWLSCWRICWSGRPFVWSASVCRAQATSLVLILFVGILLLLAFVVLPVAAARDLPHPRYAGHAK